uniref:PID domain-containing protein n=1 Tax=Panagrolaimus sp. JU765 TaxID=591449 RepID=A0AC34Q875_9BILA
MKTRASSLGGDASIELGLPKLSTSTPNCLPSTSTGPDIQLLKNATLFEHVSYLGCSKIDDPLNEKEMLEIIENFNREKAHDAISVIILIPNYLGGIVKLYEQSTKTEISTFLLSRIRCCVRGKNNSSECSCFAISFTQFREKEEIHQCHVFRCNLPEMSSKILMRFSNSFKNLEPNNENDNGQLLQTKKILSTTTTTGTPLIGNNLPAEKGIEENYQFEAFLEMKEEDKKGFTICPMEKNCLKLRRDREKRVVVVIRQVNGPRPLYVKKCFGLLLAPGKNVREADMHLLDIENDVSGENNRTYTIEGLWNPINPQFEVLNTETPKETRVCLTVAADVILEGINEPVRFNIECKARIYQQYERFFYVTRKAVNESYFLTIKVSFSFL